MIDKALWDVAEAVAEAKTLTRISKQAAARAADLIAADKDLLLRSRKALAQSRFRSQTPMAQATATNWERESAHFEMAQTHIADARERILRQCLLIEHFGRLNHPTNIAELILQTMLDTLKAMEGHREIIIDRLNQNNRVSPSG